MNESPLLSSPILSSPLLSSPLVVTNALHASFGGWKVQGWSNGLFEVKHGCVSRDRGTSKLRVQASPLGPTSLLVMLFGFSHGPVVISNLWQLPWPMLKKINFRGFYIICFKWRQVYSHTALRARNFDSARQSGGLWPVSLANICENVMSNHRTRRTERRWRVLCDRRKLVVRSYGSNMAAAEAKLSFDLAVGARSNPNS